MTDIPAFVTVRAFTSVSDAQLACTALQAAGLDARLGDEHLVSMQWLYSNAVGGVKLQVPADQVDEAREVLDTPAVVDEPLVPAMGDAGTKVLETAHQGSVTVGFRRSPDRIAAARDWQRFVSANARLLGATGLPPAATASIENWDDLLMHGFLASDPGACSVEQLTPAQHESLKELVGNYFHAGYEFYTPLALEPDDQAALRARFG